MDILTAINILAHAIDREEYEELHGIEDARDEARLIVFHEVTARTETSTADIEDWIAAGMYDACETEAQAQAQVSKIAAEWDDLNGVVNTSDDTESLTQPDGTDIVTWSNGGEWFFCVTNDATGGESDDQGGFKSREAAIDAAKQYIIDYNAE